MYRTCSWWSERHHRLRWRGPPELYAPRKQSCSSPAGTGNTNTAVVHNTALGPWACEQLNGTNSFSRCVHLTKMTNAEFHHTVHDNNNQAGRGWAQVLLLKMRRSGFKPRTIGPGGQTPLLTNISYIPHTDIAKTYPIAIPFYRYCDSLLVGNDYFFPPSQF